MKPSTATLNGELDILIVDDERLARSELHRMLLQLGMTRRIREAASVMEALADLRESPTGLLLLDIQMPGGSGFDLLKSLRPDCPPVIFTTAYEQFAVQAFELEAVDYLLKPFDAGRLAKALSRLATSDQTVEKLNESDSILLKIDGECLLLTVGSIDWIESTDRGTIVHWSGTGESFSGCTNRTIGRLEEQLDPKLFFRCSRDCLLNIRTIRSVGRDESGQLIAQLPGNRTLAFSRRQGSLFQKTHKV
jgi:two-component system LytT family response regulator